MLFQRPHRPTKNNILKEEQHLKFDFNIFFSSFSSLMLKSDWQQVHSDEK